MTSKPLQRCWRGGSTELGHCAAVTNYGQLGHNSTQEVITLQQLLKAGERIDIALFYDGVNEMACAEQTGRADSLFNEARRRAEFNLLHPERRRDLMIAALMTNAPRTFRRLRQLTGLALRGPLPAGEADLSSVDLAELAREVIFAYAANLRLVRLLAHEYGFQPIFFWQPVITTKKSKTRDEQRWVADYTRDPDRRRLLYEAIIGERRRHPELVNAADAVDLSELFDDWTDPVYIDLYHLSETGNAAVPRPCCRSSMRLSLALPGQGCRRGDVANGMVDSARCSSRRTSNRRAEPRAPIEASPTRGASQKYLPVMVIVRRPRDFDFRCYRTGISLSDWISSRGERICAVRRGLAWVSLQYFWPWGLRRPSRSNSTRISVPDQGSPARARAMRRRRSILRPSR